MLSVVLNDQSLVQVVSGKVDFDVKRGAIGAVTDDVIVETLSKNHGYFIPSNNPYLKGKESSEL